MKLGDRVGIVCDHTQIQEAEALRALLEAYTLRADRILLIQRWQAEAFFAKEARNYDWLILCCHGSTKPALRIKFEVILPKPENPELGDYVEFELTPANVPDRLQGFRGTIVSIACESGGEALGAAFLKAGCRAYLGPADYSDGSSGLLFVAAFFNFLQYEWRLPAPEKWSVAEAWAAARAVDPRAKFGTKIWRLFEHK